MATNIDGHLVDSSGNVAVDFVWGNLPLQPNDDRAVTPVVVGNINPSGLLDFALDNHVLIQTGWNGYPQYIPNTDGAAIDLDSPADGIQADEVWIVVPMANGLTTANAVKALKDAGFGTITTAAGATNAAKTVTAISRVAGQTSTICDATAHGYVVGDKVTVAASGSADANGTYIITDKADNWFQGTGTSTVVLDLSGLSATAVGVAGTIKTQSVLAGAASVAAGAAITITPFAVAS